MFRVILFKQWRLTGGRLRLWCSVAGTLYFASPQQFIAFAFNCGSGSGFACL
jgi:hypothetical protein